jgi:hypothetical protein
MQDVARLLNKMCAAGIIRDYAVFGAVAQMRYTEAVATMDVDILVSDSQDDDLTVLTPIYEFCAVEGYRPEGEAIRVNDWPVQFIPAFDRVTEDAIKHAENTEIDGEPIRVVSASYLAVIAMSVGRARDNTRILSLFESGAVSRDELSDLSDKYGLSTNWTKFQEKFLDG